MTYGTYSQPRGPPRCCLVAAVFMFLSFLREIHLLFGKARHVENRNKEKGGDYIFFFLRHFHFFLCEKEEEEGPVKIERRRRRVFFSQWETFVQQNPNCPNLASLFVVATTFSRVEITENIFF